MKSETIMPEPRLFGLINWLSAVPHCKPSSSFVLNVVSLWKMNTFFSHRSAYRDSISVGNAFFASSFGAPSLVRKPPATSWHRNFFLCSTTSSHSWPSVYTLFFLLTTSNPSSGSHSLPISTPIRLGKPGSEMLFCRRWSLTQQVKLIAVMFGLPFTTAFCLTFQWAASHSSSLHQKVPCLM